MQMAQIEGFVEAVRSGSISRAAERLYITQPALTARLQGLEREVGCVLLERGRRGVRLTDAGRTFLPYAESGLTAFEDGLRELARGNQGRIGRLMIGASPTVAAYIMPGLLHDLALHRPRSQVTVRSALSEEVLELVLREEVDVGVHRLVPHPSVSTIPLFTDELVLVASPGHRLARAGEIVMSELSTSRLILFDRTSEYYRLTSAALRAAGIEWRGFLEVDGLDAAKRTIQQAGGVGLLPRAAVSDELADGRLREVKARDMPPVRWQIVASRRKDRGLATGLTRGFLEVLRRTYSKRGESPER